MVQRTLNSYSKECKKVRKKCKRHSKFKDYVNDVRKAKLLRDIANYRPFEDLAKYGKKHISSIYRQFYRLQKEGLITADKHLTNEGKLLISHFLVGSDQELSYKPTVVNIHDLIIKASILNKPKDWETRQEILLKKQHIDYQKWAVTNWDCLEFVVNDVIIRTTPQSILIMPQQIYGESLTFAKNKAFQLATDVIPKIENIFNIKLAKDWKVSIRLARQHIALIDNEFAKFFIENKIPLRIYDENNELRALVDNSLGQFHLEFVHPRHADDDAGNMKAFIEAVSMGKFDHKAINLIAQSVPSMLKIQQNIVNTQQTQTNQLETFRVSQAEHLELVRSLKKVADQQADNNKTILELLEELRKPKPNIWQRLKRLFKP